MAGVVNRGDELTHLASFRHIVTFVNSGDGAIVWCLYYLVYKVGYSHKFLKKLQSLGRSVRDLR